MYIYIYIFLITNIDVLLLLLLLLLLLKPYKIEPAALAILGHKSAHSFEVGPVIAEPFISPLELTITPALSSKYTKQPSCLLKSFLYLIITPYNTKNNKYGIRK